MTALARTNSGVAMAAPQNMSELWKFCQTLAASDLVPKDYKDKPDNVLAAVQMGAELGLHPMQSLQGIAVINGRPSVWGDLALALIQANPDCEDVEESWDDKTKTATCVFKRRGRKPKVGTFSFADAELAGLLGKAGPWKQYPKRMTQMRARAFALRDGAADWLRGISIAEEQRDVVEATVTVVREEAPEPRALPASTQEPSNAQRPPASRQEPAAKPAEKLPTTTPKNYTAAPNVPFTSLSPAELAQHRSYYAEKLGGPLQANHRAAIELQVKACEVELERRIKLESEMAGSVAETEDGAEYDPATGELFAPADEFRGEAAAAR